LIDTDTHVIWGLNLGQNNLSAAFLEAQALTKAFASPPIKNAGIVLDAIEIGNEADLYSNNGLRPKTFTSAQYVTECVINDLVTWEYFYLHDPAFVRWIKFAQNVSGFALASSVPFWGASFAESSHSTSGFSPQAIFNKGILSSSPGSRISTYVCFLTQIRCVFLLMDLFVA
jgi:hypothetical protein